MKTADTLASKPTLSGSCECRNSIRGSAVPKRLVSEQVLSQRSAREAALKNLSCEPVLNPLEPLAFRQSPVAGSKVSRMDSRSNRISDSYGSIKQNIRSHDPAPNSMTF